MQDHLNTAEIKAQYDAVAHIDHCDLAAEQIRWSSTLLQAIEHETQRDIPDPYLIRELAAIGRYLAMNAAQNFEEESIELTERATLGAAA